MKILCWLGYIAGAAPPAGHAKESQQSEVEKRFSKGEGICLEGLVLYGSQSRAVMEQHKLETCAHESTVLEEDLGVWMRPRVYTVILRVYRRHFENGLNTRALE